MRGFPAGPAPAQHAEEDVFGVDDLAHTPLAHTPLAHTPLAHTMTVAAAHHYQARPIGWAFRLAFKEALTASGAEPI